MNKENILLSSKTLELSETKTYLELLNRVCFYDCPNLNGVELPSDTALERAQSLVDMPVKAKYTINAKGEPTFKGHEAYIDKDGELAFDTENIGVHTAVYVQDDDVEIKGEVKHLPCLFSRQKIWTRNKNVVAACKRLFTEGKLHNSWEIVSDKYEFDNGVKRLLDYVFEANTFLGYDVGVEPAYGNSAKVLSLSSDNAMSELLVAEALSRDMVEGNFRDKGSEDKEMDKKKKQDDEATPVVVENELDEVTVETPSTDDIPTVDPVTDEEDSKKRKKCGAETSSLTEWDLRKKIEEACHEKTHSWCWVAFHLPLEKTVWVEDSCRDSELDYLLFTYEADENENVTVSDPQPVKLTISIAEINKVISEKNEDIISLGKEMLELKNAVSALEPIKKAFEESEAKKAELEKEKKIAELAQYVKDSGAFSNDEIAADEIKNLISELSKSKLQEMIADRLVSNLRDKNKDTKQETATAKNETATTKKENVKSDTVDVNDINYKSVMSEFLR